MKLLLFVILSFLLKSFKCSRSILYKHASGNLELETSSSEDSFDYSNVHYYSSDSDTSGSSDVDEEVEQKKAKYRENLRIEMINNDFMLFELTKRSYLAPVKYIIEEKLGSLESLNPLASTFQTYTLKTPSNANATTPPIMYDWFYYFVSVYSLLKDNVILALESLDRIVTIAPVLEEVKVMMRGGHNGQYIPIYILVEKGYYRAADSAPESRDRGEYLTALRSEFTKMGNKYVELCHGIDLDARYGERLAAGTLLKVETVTVERDKLALFYAIRNIDLHQNNNLSTFYNVLDAVIEADWVDIAHLFIIVLIRRYHKNLPEESKNQSRELVYSKNLHAKVKSPRMARILNKKKIPLAPATAIETRSTFYRIEDQSKRSEYLKLIKLRSINNPQLDQTLRELIITRDYKKVAAYFLRKKPVRNDETAIIDAIKFANPEVLKVLLEERMELPSQTELDSAYTQNPNHREAFSNLIQTYRRFYGADGKPLVPAEQTFKSEGFKKSFPPDAQNALAAVDPTAIFALSTDYYFHECDLLYHLTETKRLGYNDVVTRFADAFSKWRDIM